MFHINWLLCIGMYYRLLLWVHNEMNMLFCYVYGIHLKGVGLWDFMNVRQESFCREMISWNLISMWSFLPVIGRSADISCFSLYHLSNIVMNKSYLIWFWQLHKCHIHVPLQWRQNERDGVSNHQPHDCLLNRLFRHRSKKTSKPRVTGLCAGDSSMTGKFPAQKASTAEKVSIRWRHHGMSGWCVIAWVLSFARTLVIGDPWDMHIIK